MEKLEGKDKKREDSEELRRRTAIETGKRVGKAPKATLTIGVRRGVEESDTKETS